jgi:hypothetical protein
MIRYYSTWNQCCNFPNHAALLMNIIIRMAALRKLERPYFFIHVTIHLLPEARSCPAMPCRQDNHPSSAKGEKLSPYRIPAVWKLRSKLTSTLLTLAMSVFLKIAAGINALSSIGHAAMGVNEVFPILDKSPASTMRAAAKISWMKVCGYYVISCKLPSLSFRVVT